MDFSNIVFRRQFALNMYKDKKLLLGKMSFAKDFVNDTRGDLYPLLEKSADCAEAVENNRYLVIIGSAKRMLCRFFPYAAYALSVQYASDSAGFCFHLPHAEVNITVQGRALVFTCGEAREKATIPPDIREAWTLLVSCRPGAFDVYFEVNGGARFFRTFACAEFAESNRYADFSNGYAAITVSGSAVVTHAESYLDSGISQADIRPIRYEDGTVMVEQGRIYLTLSIRLQAEMLQGVFSWVPGTAEFELTGALFFDCGDGKWCGDVASSILYHRGEHRWYHWVCAFSHGHILGHAEYDADPRFGVNVIDIELMEKAPAGAAITEFLGFEGDEDPDFFFDAKTGKWRMAVCRCDPAINAYRYMFFESDHPFDGYTCIGQGLDGAETGGSFVKIRGEQLFVCGNDFKSRSDYRIYSKTDMQNAVFDHPDGGFRGWGTLMPIKLGTRTRYFWLTFDRHNGSGYNWSYGNIYCFEAEIS